MYMYIPILITKGSPVVGRVVSKAENAEPDQDIMFAQAPFVCLSIYPSSYLFLSV